MSSAASTSTWTPFETLRLAGEIMRQEATAIQELAASLPTQFVAAVDTVCGCEGSVIVTGMGKAGLVGQKIMATLASTGTPSHFLHPSEAVHGDLGRVTSRDLVLLLSFSGNTAEVLRLLSPLREIGAGTIAITAAADSELAKSAGLTLTLGRVDEACTLGLAPSTSTTLMLALGDALALVVSRRKGFSPVDFARFHPAGSLGRKLAKVEEVMRPLKQCRVAADTLAVADVVAQANRPGRRTGAIMLTGDTGALTGIFTDSDLARLLAAKNFSVWEAPINEVMTRDPLRVITGTSMAAAITLLADNKISELPVVNAAGVPVGLIDITDVVGL